MKKLITGYLLVSMVLFAANALAAVEGTDGLIVWAGFGSQSGEFTFEESVTGTSHYDVEFDVPDSYFSIGARYQFLATTVPELSFQFSMRVSREAAGGSVDERGELDGVSTPVFVATSDLEGLDYNANDFQAAWKFVESDDQKIYVEALVGHTYLRYKYDIENQTTTIAAGVPTSTTIASDLGDYDVRIRGYYFGLGAGAWLNDHLGIEGSIKFSPELRGEATGNWRPYDSTFEHESQGPGLEAFFAATLIPKENWAISVAVTITDFDLDEEGDDDGVQNFVLSTGAFAGFNNLDTLEVSTVSSEIRISHYFS